MLTLPLVAAIVALQQDTAGARDTLRTKPPQSLDVMQVRADGARRPAYRPTSSSSSTRTPTPLREIPQAITSFSAPLLRDLALPTVARALEYVPGVVIGQGEGHRDAPSIRGQSTTADFYIDGVRDDAQYYRDTYNVAQLDVLKGANAAVFGRGGGGGIVNRVMKQAAFTPVRSARVEGASFGQRRLTLDVGQRVAPHTAARLNLLREDGAGYRRDVRYDRFGVNPTVGVTLGSLLLQAGGEHFVDRRTIDRGIPSANGIPSAVDPRAFVGDPTKNPSRLTAQHGFVIATWALPAGVQLRTHARAYRYDKFYQNTYASSALNAAGTQFSLGAYNTATDRQSAFNQTDVVWTATRGPLRHTLLAGTEISRQRTDNRRETGYFGNTTTTYAVRPDAPTVSVPITWRQSVSDADNRATTQVTAAFAQEQLRLGERVSLLAGVRADRVHTRVVDRRSPNRFARTDHLVAPRAALILTPAAPLSLYGSVSTAFLPSSGDQFGALTATTQTLAPEAFRNREVGAKWAVTPGLDLTGAWFVLDRSNTAAPDPADPTRLVQTGRQQTRGAEVGLQGAVTPRWDVMGGLAVQRARIVSRTSAAPAGASVPLVPHTTVSLWNKVRLTDAWSVALGAVHQGDRFAAVDNTVRLPAFTRLDGGLFVRLPLDLSMHVQVENLLDTRYTATSHGNNNIMPGAGRTLRVSLTY